MKSNLRTPLIIIAAALVVLACGTLLGRLVVLLPLVAIAAAWAAGIDPLVTWLERPFGGRLRLPRTLAAVIVLFVAVVILCGVVAVFIATAAKQTTDFMDHSWPELQVRLTYWLKEIGTRHGVNIDPSTIFDRISGAPGQIGTYLSTTTQALIGALGLAFFVLALFILTLFFSIMKDDMLDTLSRLVPPDYRERAREVAVMAGERMGGWLRGQVTLGFIMAGVTMPAMWAIGVNYPVLIGVLGGIGELIPMVGPYLAFWPALIIVLATPGHQLWHVLAVIGFFGVLILTENYYLAPTIMKRYVGLAPVTTLLAVLIGGAALGFFGVFLAIPLTAAGSAVMDEVIFPAIEGMKSKAEEGADP